MFIREVAIPLTFTRGLLFLQLIGSMRSSDGSIRQFSGYVMSVAIYQSINQ